MSHWFVRYKKETEDTFFVRVRFGDLKYAMATSSPDTAFIAARSAKLGDAYNRKDIDAALEMFVDEGLEHSDFGKLFDYHPCQDLYLSVLCAVTLCLAPSTSTSALIR